MMDNGLETLELWTKQKYDYYVAARTLWQNNQMQMAALMYAYAIEAQIKSALVMWCSTEKLKGMYDHDIPQLFARAKGYGLFDDVSVSSDFLEFVMDNFERRYPKQTRERLKAIRPQGRAFILICDLDLYYDQFIMDLDASIYKKSNDRRTSMLSLVARNLESLEGRYFFQLNPAALARLDEPVKWLKDELAAYENDPKFTTDYPVHVWARKRDLGILEQMNHEWLSRDKYAISTLNKVVFPSDFKHP